MEAKDTVMSVEQNYELRRAKFDEITCRQENLMYLADHRTFKVEYEISEFLKEKQAEISFKAGYGEGLKQGYADNRDEKKAGRKEVAEAVEQYVSIVRKEDGIIAIPSLWDITEAKLWWQAKLKEWEIN